MLRSCKGTNSLKDDNALPTILAHFSNAKNAADGHPMLGSDALAPWPASADPLAGFWPPLSGEVENTHVSVAEEGEGDMPLCDDHDAYARHSDLQALLAPLSPQCHVASPMIADASLLSMSLSPPDPDADVDHDGSLWVGDHETRCVDDVERSPCAAMSLCNTSSSTDTAPSVQVPVGVLNTGANIDHVSGSFGDLPVPGPVGIHDGALNEEGHNTFLSNVANIGGVVDRENNLAASSIFSPSAPMQPTLPIISDTLALWVHLLSCRTPSALANVLAGAQQQGIPIKAQTTNRIPSHPCATNRSVANAFSSDQAQEELVHRLHALQGTSPQSAVSLQYLLSYVQSMKRSAANCGTSRDVGAPQGLRHQCCADPSGPIEPNSAIAAHLPKNARDQQQAKPKAVNCSKSAPYPNCTVSMDMEFAASKGAASTNITSKSQQQKMRYKSRGASPRTVNPEDVAMPTAYATAPGDGITCSEETPGSVPGAHGNAAASEALATPGGVARGNAAAPRAKVRHSRKPRAAVPKDSAQDAKTSKGALLTARYFSSPEKKKKTYRNVEDDVFFTEPKSSCF